MSFLARFSPFRAVRDLRTYLATRKPYELWFMLLALVVTVAIIAAFAKDSRMERPYKRNIIYVENWPLTRTDAEIIAQQKVDQAKKRVIEAELEKKREAQRQEFKKVDNALKSIGL
jgi:hypothetical protein